jgi:hypothetical protein
LRSVPALGLFLVGQTKVPIEEQSLALGVADNALTVAPELRIVRGEQLETGQDPGSELLDERAVAEVRMDLPVGGNGPEIHDAHVPAWGFVEFRSVGGE